MPEVGEDFAGRRFEASLVLHHEALKLAQDAEQYLNLSPLWPGPFLVGQGMRDYRHDSVHLELDGLQVEPPLLFEKTGPPGEQKAEFPVAYCPDVAAFDERLSASCFGVEACPVDLYASTLFADEGIRTVAVACLMRTWRSVAASGSGHLALDSTMQ